MILNSYDLANAIARLENKRARPRFTIRQVREIVRITRKLLKAYADDAILAWVTR